MLKRHTFYLSTTLTLGLIFGSHGTAFAQESQSSSQSTPLPQAAAAAQVSSDEDDAKPQPMEPDFRVVNLPTTLRVPRHGGNFTLTHRFNGDLTEGSFLDQLSILFGMDEGAAMGFEYRYGIMRHVEAVAFRTNIAQTIQFSGKWDEWRQGEKSMPISISPFVSVEGQTNFRNNYSTSVGASVSHNVHNKLMVYAVPWIVMNSAAGSGDYRNTFALGLGARAQLRPRLFAVVEVTPRLGGYTPGDEEYAFGIETRVGGHVFQLNFANSQQTTMALLSHGGSNDKLYLGFNLSRKFF